MMKSVSDTFFDEIQVWDIRVIIEALGHVPSLEEMGAWLRAQRREREGDEVTYMMPPSLN